MCGIFRTLRQYYATAHGRHDVQDDARAVVMIVVTVMIILALCCGFGDIQI